MRRASAAIVCALGLILAGGASAQSEGAIISFSISESGVAGAGLLQETVKHADGSSTVVPAAIKSGTIPAISVNRGVFGRFHLTLKVVGGAAVAARAEHPRRALCVQRS